MKAVLKDYALRRAQLLTANMPLPQIAPISPGIVAPPAAAAMFQVEKQHKAPGAHGLRWRAPRGRMARELSGGK